jgi:lysophospholipase L1-like esterase
MNALPLRRRYVALLTLLMVPALGLSAEPPPSLPADVPQERTDANSRQAHQDLLAKRGKGRIDLYFVGDSITRRWGAAESKYSALLAHWQKSFHGWNAADFGWGGDTTRNILWRLDHDELTGVNPRVIVIMAGTNNLAVQAQPEAREAQALDVARGIEAILRRCQQLAPQARIVLMGITPRNDNMDHMPVIARVNAQLARLADGNRVRFIDLGGQLADAQGMLLPGMTDPDKLHLALPAYEIWAQALRPVLLEWLGPPAAEDRAPPPTGDPSAMQAGR